MPSRNMLRGRSILMVECDSFIAGYISSVLMAARARVIGPVASMRDAKTILAGGRDPIHAGVLSCDMSCEDRHRLADELAQRGVPSLLIDRHPAQAEAILQGRPRLIWPFAAFEVREMLAGMIKASDGGSQGAVGLVHDRA